MEGYALELSCLALHRVWGAVPGDFIWHGFFRAGFGMRGNGLGGWSGAEGLGRIRGGCTRYAVRASWKDENNNKLLFCGMPRKASRLLF